MEEFCPGSFCSWAKATETDNGGSFESDIVSVNTSAFFDGSHVQNHC